MFNRKDFPLGVVVLAFSVAMPERATRASPEQVSHAPVEVRLEAERAVLQNDFLRIEVSLGAERPGADLVKNLRSGRELTLEGEDFILELADGGVVRSSELRRTAANEETAPPDGRRLVLDYSVEDLRLRLVTEMRAGEWWATRWLEIQSGRDAPVPPRRLAAVSLARWRCADALGPTGPGETVGALGYPSGCGQAVYVDDLFFAIAHPGAENFATGGFVSCRIPASDELGRSSVHTRELVIGSGEAGDARRAFLGYIDATRAVDARMVFLVNDWYWKDKSKPLEALEELARVKQQSGVPIDSFTLDDGWDFDWDETTGIWGRLHRQRFPGGWEALEAAGRPAGLGVSLWFGPIGGYGYRPKRIAFARKLGFEIQGDKLCLAGPRYRQHVVESFSKWAALGMDYIKVDGFWPDCQVESHGHAVVAAGAIAQMDALMEVFAAWRRARADLLIGYTSGSNPSPFWLRHADFVWRGGRDDSHAGAGEPFDRHNTYLDSCLQLHRQTDMPMSAFVTFDIVQGRIAGHRDEAFERGCWWLAARTSLHHDWYIQASDLDLKEWKTLAKVARWARRHEKLFRWSRMVGGDPGRGEVYGFSAFDEGRGTLALRNPGTEPRALESTLAGLLELPDAARERSFKLKGVFGETKALEGPRPASAPLRVELPPLAIAIVEVEPAPRAPERRTAREKGTLRFDRARGASFSFDGRIGERVDRNVDGWLLSAPIANPGMLDMFRVRDREPPPDLVPWAGEFAGKYLISAIQALRMTARPEVERFVARVVRDLLATQAADGYLGPFPRETRLLGNWDLWGHYHVILALLMWHERTGDEKALIAACRAGDLVCRTYLDTGRRVYDAGSHEMNMAIIHALGKLYRLTGTFRYLRMMREIEKDWEGAGDYCRQALAGVEFFQTPRPRWESLHDIQGLVELYRITGDETYRQAFLSLWTSIRQRERHNTGGFSSGEKAVGHPYSAEAIETCCTIAWMALTLDMLRLTGDPEAADELELSTLNAVAGAQHPSGRWWTYSTPMDGVREASAHSIVFQSRAGTPELNCCSVNAPRGLGMLSEWAVMRSDDGVVVNYYGPSTATLQSPGGDTKLVLEQDRERTTYPEGNEVVLRVAPEEPREFDLQLRIPAWSTETEARLNGEIVPDVRAGTYLKIGRRWQRGDTVSLRFDQRLRIWTGDRQASGRISVFRGPVLLAYDQRWNSFDEEEIPLLDASEIEGLRVAPRGHRREGALEPWTLLTLEGVDGRTLTLCDFATAGAAGTRYRSWLAARNSHPPQVLLDRPADRETIGPGKTLFAWSGFEPRSPSASFRLLVSTQADFLSPVVIEECRANRHVPETTFSADKTYYWKVVAVAEGKETGSEVRSFRVDAARRAMTERELEAWFPDANGLLVAASLRGTADPERGILQDTRGMERGTGPHGESSGAIVVDGRTGRVRYRVPYYPSEDSSVTLWINIRRFPQGLGQVFSAWAAGMDDPLRICVAGRELYARVEAGRAYSTNGTPVESGKWMHVAAVKEGSQLRLYLDGTSVGSATVPASIPSSARNIGLGANPNYGGNEYLAAALADFRLYVRALSADEVKEIAAAPGRQ